MAENDSTPTTPATDPATEGQSFSADYVKTLRDEAARYRNEKKDAVETAKTETRAEVVKEYEPQLAAKDSEISDLKSTNEAQATELLKLKAIVKAEIATDSILEVFDLVQGTDEETVSASVERVKSLIGKTPPKDRLVDPSQGSGSHIPLNGDPIVNMFKQAIGC